MAKFKNLEKSPKSALERKMTEDFSLQDLAIYK